MKRGKDEGKLMSPLFPRLHVNDTEKGGPRAPPRNKMALYEQFSVPKAKVSSRSTFILPLPPNNSSIMVPSAPSTHDTGYQRKVVTPFCYTPVTAHVAEKHHSHSSSGVNMSSGMTNLDKKSGTVYPILNATEKLPFSANSSSSQSHCISRPNNSRVEDYYEVPTFCQSGIIPDFYDGNKERGTYLDLNASVQLESASEKYPRNLDMSHSRENFLAVGSSSLLTRDEIFEPSKRARTSEKNKSNMVANIRGLEYIQDSHHQVSMTLPENTDFPNPSEARGGRPVSTSCRQSLLGDHRKSGRAEHGLEDQKESEPFQMGSNDKNCRVSNANLVGSMLGFDLSPDDVVGIIGPKHFWKARNEIVNQQRLFAVQVFELHRLIMVQRLIAGSPESLQDNNTYLAKLASPTKKAPSASPTKKAPSASSTKKGPSASPTKKLPSESVQELPSQSVNPKDDSQRQNSNNEGAVKDAVGNLPFASPLDTKKTQIAHQGPPENPLPVYMGTDFQPWQGNQWLVPMMSPSAGLIYKPYAGHCPPAPLTSPAYGNYRPINLNPMGGDLFITSYGFPISHHQGIGILPSNPLMGQTYFPSFASPSTSGSAVEQMNLSVGDQSSRLNNPVSAGNINVTVQSMPSQSFGNMSTLKNGCFGKFQASYSCESQLSMASAPSVRTPALPLFPVTLKAQESDPADLIHGNEKQTRAIKVVPHEQKSATESAARIFLSIQEERNQRGSQGDNN